MHSLLFTAILDVNHLMLFYLLSLVCDSVTTTNAHSLLSCEPKLLGFNMFVVESQSCE